MTMNMPPFYNQQPSYLQRPTQGYSNVPSQLDTNATYETLRPSQQNVPPMSVNQPYSQNIPSQYNPNRSQSPINVPSNIKNTKNIGGIPPNVPRQNVGGQYLNPQIDQSIYQQINR